MSFSLSTDAAIDMQGAVPRTATQAELDLEAGQGLLTPGGSPQEDDFDPTPVIPDSTPDWLIGKHHAPLSRLPPPPSPAAWVFLAVNMAAPVGMMFLGLGVFKSAWAAILLFHAVPCLLLPVLYTFVFVDSRPRSIWYKDLWARTFNTAQSPNKPSRGPHITSFSFLLAAATATIGFLGYLLFRAWVPNIAVEAAEYGLGTAHTGSTYLWVAYFSFVNPFLEEFFWRAFLQSAWSRSWTGPVPVQSFWYAVYHAVPVAVFFNGWYATGAVVVLIIAGFIFSAQFQRYGGHANVAFHIGADLAIGVIAINMIWGIV